MDAAEMLRKQRQARTAWHELDDPPRRALQLRRPQAINIAQWSTDNLREHVLDVVCTCIADWRGFTEADLLGAAIGSATEQQFDASVVKEWLGDEPSVLNAIATRLVEMVQTQVDAKAGAEKN